MIYIKVGIIDSGIGGKAILNNLEKRYPFFDYYLVMDKAYFPYGNKDSFELSRRCIALTNYLLEKRVDNIILGCNTISILLYSSFRSPKYLNIARMTIKYIKESNYRNIVVLGTKNTIESKFYELYLPDRNILGIDASILIDLLEKKKDYEKELYSIITLLPSNTDLLVLGCTHFIEIKHHFRKLFSNVLSQDELIFFPKGKVSIVSTIIV